MATGQIVVVSGGDGSVFVRCGGCTGGGMRCWSGGKQQQWDAEAGSEIST